MDDEMNFLHPAEDPSTLCIARARTHVARTVRRRHTRRRTLVSAPLVAMLGVAAVASGSLLRSRAPDRQIVASEPGAGRTRLAFDPDTTWSQATLSKDGRVLTFQVETIGDGTEECEQVFVHDVVESSRSITVGIDERTPTGAGRPARCALITARSVQRFDVELEEPLGDREVYDGVQPAARDVFRQTDLVEVTQLPDGFTGAEPDAGVGNSGEGWQQVFANDGADWAFAVTQEPPPGAEAPHGTISPVTIDGIVGQRYSGPADDPMETIRWVEGDLLISVSGRMTGDPRPAFTHHDELLHVAEGVRPPRR